LHWNKKRISKFLDLHQVMVLALPWLEQALWVSAQAMVAASVILMGMTVG
jgi:hypothetical protein